MEFGVFDHNDSSGQSLRDFYATRLRLVERFDRAGFYAYHVAEHHGTPLGLAPSPALFLAGAIQRTTRIQIKENLIAERIACEHYRELIRYFGDNDSTTRVMLEGILVNEEEHANDMHDLLVSHEGKPMLSAN